MSIVQPAGSTSGEPPVWLGIDTRVWVAVIAALATLIVGYFGPAWKSKHDLVVQRRQRSSTIIARYSEPLAGAAYDLQSRLYNIIRRAFLQSYYHSNDVRKRTYTELSTVWLFGQYFAWTEILRREVQVLDVGDYRATARLSRLLARVEWVFLSDSQEVKGLFQIWKQDQRALGELMTITRKVDDVERNDCMGYAEFVMALSPNARAALGTVEDLRAPTMIPPTRWLRKLCLRLGESQESTYIEQGPSNPYRDRSALQDRVTPLLSDLGDLTVRFAEYKEKQKQQQQQQEKQQQQRWPWEATRLAWAQNALIDLIDELDPDRVRFPHDLRSKINVGRPEPDMMQRLRPPSGWLANVSIGPRRGGPHRRGRRS